MVDPAESDIVHEYADIIGSLRDPARALLAKLPRCERCPKLPTCRVYDGTTNEGHCGVCDDCVQPGERPERFDSGWFAEAAALEALL